MDFTTEELKQINLALTAHRAGLVGLERAKMSDGVVLKLAQAVGAVDSAQDKIVQFLMVAGRP